MRLTCPGCGVHGSLELFSSDVDARAVAALMGEIPPQLAKPVTEYLSLFRPAKRVLAWRRVRKLLEELLPDIKAQRIERKGRTWLAPHVVWIRAIDEMIAGRERLTLPLKSHGYLLEVVVGAADKIEAGEERGREQKIQANAAPDSAPAAIGDLLVRSLVMNENRTRLQLGQPPMTPDQEREYIARQAS